MYIQNTDEPFLFFIHAVTSEITFYMPKNGTAYIGQIYSVNCAITANPRKRLYMYVSSSDNGSCDFQSEESLHIGRYTTKTTVRINVTQACRTIICSTNLLQEQRVLGKQVAIYMVFLDQKY